MGIFNGFQRLLCTNLQLELRRSVSHLFCKSQKDILGKFDINWKRQQTGRLLRFLFCPANSNAKHLIAKNPLQIDIKQIRCYPDFAVNACCVSENRNTRWLIKSLCCLCGLCAGRAFFVAVTLSHLESATEAHASLWKTWNQSCPRKIHLDLAIEACLHGRVKYVATERWISHDDIIVVRILRANACELK